MSLLFFNTGPYRM